jgi:hypothetical protein
MDWVPGLFSDSREQFLAGFNRIAEEVAKESQNL